MRGVHPRRDEVIAAWPFDESTIAVIDQLKHVYGLELRADDSHQLLELDRQSSR
jgi:hypothetical protein